MTEIAKLDITPSIEIKSGSATLQNKEEIAALLKESEKYKGLIITKDSDATFVYRTRSKLNGLIKLIDDERKRVKKEMEVPIKLFEKEMNDLKGIVAITHTDLDATYKAYEKVIKDKKQELVDQIIEEHSQGHEIPFNPKWLNKGYLELQIIKDVQQIAIEKQIELDRLDKSIETIINACSTHGLTPDGYIQVLKTGSRDVLDIIQDINDAGERKRVADELKKEEEARQAAYNAEVERANQIESQQEQPAEPIQVVEEVASAEVVMDENETGELVTNVIEVTATLSQLKALNRFMVDNNIRVKAYEG